MSQVATTTYLGRTKRALAFKGLTLWACLGRTTTPWTDDQNPPTPTPGSSDIEEALSFVKATVQTLCRPVTQEEWDALGSNDRVPLPVNGVYYAYVADGDAYSQLARWAYQRFVADPSDGQPTGIFRQVGLFSGLVPAAGHEGASWLDPEDVDERGILEWLDNNPPVVLSTSYRHTAHIVIEFR